MAQKIALFLGTVFVLLGLLGFVPNPIAGPGALFQTDTLHNLVHLITGLIMVILAKTQAKKTIIFFGVVYLAVAVIGFLTGSSGMILGLFQANMADHWLHLIMASLLLVVALKK